MQLIRVLKMYFNNRTYDIFVCMRLFIEFIYKLLMNSYIEHVNYRTYHKHVHKLIHVHVLIHELG